MSVICVLDFSNYSLHVSYVDINHQGGVAYGNLEKLLFIVFLIKISILFQCKF